MGDPKWRPIVEELSVSTRDEIRDWNSGSRYKLELDPGWGG